jgi:outer membrane cobalamin receptor
MDSTDIIDLKITKKLNNSNFYIKVTNALDENYQKPHGYNQENRVYKIWN